MGREMRIVADPTIKEGVYITGANKAGFHMRGVRPGEHFKAEWVDIHEAKAGDGCPECGAPMTTEACIEIGNIFKLGTKYSVPLKAMYLDDAGKEHPIIMGSYGIGPARIMAAAVEQGNDKDGIVWPGALAPFDVEIIPLNLEHAETAQVAAELYEKLTGMGLDVLFDDRDMRAGPKFKDADLIGIPKHIVIGERGLKEGLVELKDRKTGETVKLRPEDVPGALKG